MVTGRLSVPVVVAFPVARPFTRPTLTVKILVLLLVQVDPVVKLYCVPFS
jgi:hypothetical protein